MQWFLVRAGPGLRGHLCSARAWLLKSELHNGRSGHRAGPLELNCPVFYSTDMQEARHSDMTGLALSVSCEACLFLQVLVPVVADLAAQYKVGQLVDLMLVELEGDELLLLEGLNFLFLGICLLKLKEGCSLLVRGGAEHALVLGVKTTVQGGAFISRWQRGAYTFRHIIIFVRDCLNISVCRSLSSSTA